MGRQDEGRDPEAQGPRASNLVLALLLVLLGLALRLSVFELPLDADAADTAVVAQRVLGRPGAPGSGVGPAPLLSVLLVPLLALGLAPTFAYRVLDVLLAVLVAPLLLRLGVRVGARRRVAFWAALLWAMHPVALAATGGAGGPTHALALLMVLGAALALGAQRPRWVAVLAGLLPLAEPLGFLAAPALLAWAVARDRGPARLLGPVLVAGSLVLAALPGAADTTLASRAFAALVMLGPVVALGVGVLFLPRGLGALLGAVSPSAAAAARIWAVTVGLDVAGRVALPLRGAFALDESGLTAAALAAPFLLLAVSVGLERSGKAARWRWRTALVLLALFLGLPVISGAVQMRLAPERPWAAARLHLLGRAVRTAAGEVPAGQTLWVEDREIPAAQAALLSDLAPERGLKALGPSVQDRPTQTPLVVVTRAADLAPVTTLGGRGVYRQEVVARFGPWFVLRLHAD